MKKSFFVGSLLLLTAGLGLKPIATQTIAKQVVSQTQPSIAPVSQSKVELLSAGVQPRQTLRFKPAVNTIETTTITLNMATEETSIPGMSTPSSTKLPSTLMEMETVVTQVDPNGDIHYKLRYTNADMTGDASTPPGVIDELRARVKKIVGLNGSFVMDNRGRTKSKSLTIPKSVDATTRQMLEQSDELFTPLPDAAVGVGAQWKTLMPAKTYGMTINQTETYELVSLKDGVATLKLGFKQQAQGQKLAIPGMPKGANVTLKSLSETGQGEIKVRLDRLLPPTAKLSLTSVAEMQFADPRTSKLMTTLTKTQMEMMLQSK